jgi:hypothetical protein
MAAMVTAKDVTGMHHKHYEGHTSTSPLLLGIRVILLFFILRLGPKRRQSFPFLLE